MGKKSAFTLIELLVVIAIIALLMAVLLPTLGRVRKRAKAAACQAKLRQWGVVFSMYLGEHDDRFSTRETTGWWHYSRAYYAECNDLLLCPMAPRYEVNKEDPRWADAIVYGWGLGSKFTAWKATVEVGSLKRKMVRYGGYGTNFNAIDTYALEPSDIKRPRIPARSSMPFLLDSVGVQNYMGGAQRNPPRYDGDLGHDDGHPGMKWFCIDRHDGAINSLFMDWSVRRVGLKELWTLKWCGPYDTRGRWTKAGGVQPEDWPKWMRNFKDY